MLSSLSRIIAHAAPRPLVFLQSGSKQIGALAALYATFTARDLFAGSQGEAGTLNYRFVKHIALESCKTDPLVPQRIKYADFFPLTDIRSFRKSVHEISTEQIPRLIIFTYTYKTNGDPQKISLVLNEIDAVCLERIESMDHETLLSSLYAFMFLIPNKITKFDFFARCIQRLVMEMNEDCPRDRFVQICFYLGQWKKHRRSIDLMNRIKDNFLDKQMAGLNQVEFAIVANALFKSSTICSSTEFKQRLVDEVLNCDGKDDSLLVTFVKSLRLNRVKSGEIYEKLEKLLVADSFASYQFKGLVHIFAMFADGLHNDPKICRSFVELCLEKLETADATDQYVFNDMRAKDMATFLWSCAHLNCSQLLAEHCKYLAEIVLRKVDRDEFKYCPDELIDSTLSLWMLGHQSHDLVRAVFDLPSNPRQDNSDRVKLDSRLELLKSCVQIEKPDWMQRGKNRNQTKAFDESRPAREYYVKNRNALQNVSGIIDANKDELSVRDVKFVVPIEQLNVAGILIELENGGKCFVEVLEENQLLKFEDKPVSIVALKLRLLENLGYNTIVIRPDVKDTEQVLEVLKENLNDIEPKLSIKTVAT